MLERLDIATPDGTMPVWRQGTGPVGLLVYMDVFGIRPELHAMCADLAAEGYTTFLPDLFYRAGTVAFSPREPVPAQARRLNTETTWAMSSADTRALLAAVPTPPTFVSAGYCMGARHALAAAALLPERVKACALLHGGRLVSENAVSPHHLIARLEGPAYVAFAADDPTCPPAHRSVLTQAFAATAPAHRIEAFDAHHGFMFPQRDVFDPAAAAAARSAMLRLFHTALKDTATP